MALFAKAAGGLWSAASTWSATGSGGADNAGPPLTSTDVVFEAGSGNVTIDVGAVCRSIDCTSGTGNYAGTLTHGVTTTLNIGDATAGAGNVALKFVAGMTYTITVAAQALNFVSTSATVQTISQAGVGQFGSMFFNGVGGSWQFATTMFWGTGSAVTLTAGTLNTNNNNCQGGLLVSSNTNTRSLTLGTSTITLTGGNASALDLGTSTNLTLSAASSTLNFTGPGSTASDSGTIGVGHAWGTINATGSGTFTLAFTQVVPASTIVNFTRIGTATKTDVMNFNNVGANNISGSLTLTGNSVTNRLLVKGQTGQGTTRTLTTTGATISVSNCDFQDINFVPSQNFSGNTGLTGDAGGNTGIIFTPAVSQTWQGISGGNWSDITKWTSRVPLPQDNVSISSNFGINQTIIMDMPRMCRDLDFTGTTGAPTINVNNSDNIYGSLTLVSNVKFAASGNSFAPSGRGTHTITTNGVIFRNPTIIGAGLTGTYTLLDNLNVVNTFTLLSGTLSANGFDVTCTQFAGGGTNFRTLNMGSGTWTLSGTGSIWNVSPTTNLAFNGQISTIVIAETDGQGKQFTSGGFGTYNNITIVGGGSGDITFINNSGLACNVFTINGPKTIKFIAGYGLVCNYFYSNGLDANNLVVMKSLINGIPWALSVNRGYGVSFTDLQDSRAVTSIV